MCKPRRVVYTCKHQEVPMIWQSDHPPVEVGGATLDAMVRATAARVPAPPRARRRRERRRRHLRRARAPRRPRGGAARRARARPRRRAGDLAAEPAGVGGRGARRDARGRRGDRRQPGGDRPRARGPARRLRRHARRHPRRHGRARRARGTSSRSATSCWPRAARCRRRAPRSRCCRTRAGRPASPRPSSSPTATSRPRCASSRPALRLSERDTLVAVAPFAHVMGFVPNLAVPLAAGATVVTMPRFDPARYLELADAPPRDRADRRAAPHARAGRRTRRCRTSS